MILDTGTCSIYRLTNTATSGDMPNETPVLVDQPWYGELSYESAPVQNTESQEEVEIAMRIRVLRTISIDKKCLVQIGTDAYKVERAYSGIDGESGERIFDLSLSRRASIYAAN